MRRIMLDISQTTSLRWRVPDAARELARELGIDPFTFRRRNVVQPGDPLVSSGIATLVASVIAGALWDTFGPAARLNSTAKKIFGNSCGRTGCRTEFSNPSTTSSITAAIAWNTLIDQPWKIMSIARRDWAAAGHSI